MTDPVLRMLARLPDLEPDPARAERVRARCRQALAAQPTSPRENAHAPRAMGRPPATAVPRYRHLRAMGTGV